jgi:hypothetical protein
VYLLSLTGCVKLQFLYRNFATPLKKNCNIRTTHDLRRNYGLAKSKFQNVGTTQELEKTLEKEDQELLM